MRLPFAFGCVAVAALAQRPLPPVPADPPPETPPLGLPAAFAEPPTNPFTRAKWELGRALFFEPALSDDGAVACASCHDPAHGFATADRFAHGVRGRTTKRHAPALLNRGFGGPQFWDGRSPTLEDQVLKPIEDPDEMGSTVEAALARASAKPAVAALFAAAETRPTRAAAADALATYVRRLTHGDTPVDRFRAAQRAELSADERAGLWIYESKGRCWTCHGGPNFTDESFRNTGVGAALGVAEPGRAAITGSPADRGRFKVPTLRGAALSPPYFHDGSAATLEDVVAFYARGGGKNPDLDPTISEIRLDPADSAPLVAFLKALSRQASDADAPR
jgi:cytochrome c peroxidase